MRGGGLGDDVAEPMSVGPAKRVGWMAHARRGSNPARSHQGVTNTHGAPRFSPYRVLGVAIAVALLRLQRAAVFGAC
jgi:hypothetical protein